MLTQTQTVEKPQLAKICGNCVHGESFHKLRGRLPQLLAFIKAFQPGSSYLSPELVSALQYLFKVQEWKSRCKVEKTWVRMFDRACANWEGSMEG